MGSYQFSIIFAVYRRARATSASDKSEADVKGGAYTQVSAFSTRGCIIDSSSIIRCHMVGMSNLDFRVISRSTTNSVANTTTCWASRNTDQDYTCQDITL